MLFGGSLFLLDGTWRSYQLHVHTGWPAVDARVVECKVSGYDDYNSFRHASGSTSYVRCSFEYETAGVARQTTIDVGNSVFTSGELRTFLTYGLTVAQMRKWVNRHPSGSRQTIHFNPSRPEEISLAGAEEDLDMAKPERSMWAGLIASCGGMILIGVGKRVRGPARVDETFPLSGS